MDITIEYLHILRDLRSAVLIALQSAVIHLGNFSDPNCRGEKIECELLKMFNFHLTAENY